MYWSRHAVLVNRSCVRCIVTGEDIIIAEMANERLLTDKKMFRRSPVALRKQRR